MEKTGRVFCFTVVLYTNCYEKVLPFLNVNYLIHVFRLVLILPLKASEWFPGLFLLAPPKGIMPQGSLLPKF